MDDALIASSSESEHLLHIECIFQHLLEAGLRTSVGKWKFPQNHIKFLGHKISPDRIQLGSDEVETIPMPTTVKELGRFLSMLNFYRRFLTNAAHHQAIPNAYLSGTETKDSHKAVQVFEIVEQQLVDATLLDIRAG